MEFVLIQAVNLVLVILQKKFTKLVLQNTVNNLYCHCTIMMMILIYLSIELKN